MSFVREVLSAAEKVEIENINKEIPDIVCKIKQNKQDVVKYIESVHKYFERLPKHNKILLSRVSDLTTQINKLKNNIENIMQSETTDCLSKLSSYKCTLDEVNYALKISSQLMEIHETLLNIENCQNKHEYVQAVMEINKIKAIIAVMRQKDNLDVLEELEINTSAKQLTLTNKLTNTFKDNVQLKDDMPYMIKINKQNEELKEVLKAFVLYKPHSTPLDDVTKFLWEYVFMPIVSKRTTVEITENDICILCVNVLNGNDKNNYKCIFHNLTQILEFLIMHFKYPLQEGVSTLSYIGNDIRDNLSELLIKQCLNDTIPSTSDELENYKEVIADCEVLQCKLVESEIFTSDTSSILDHANNVDIHFINKKCQEYVNTAVTIMKKDLHDMVEVGIPHDGNKPLQESSNGFPQCYVSKSCIELTHLVDKIIEIATTSSDICAGHLYCTIQKIFYMYEIVVQKHHQRLLQTIPQQVSLFHNNCMYLSYKLNEWNEPYQKKFPSTLGTNITPFSEKANLLKSVGDSIFKGCIQQQTKQIEEILCESGLMLIPTLDHLEPTVEKCIRQCLRQQELLKTVWYKVLCYLDYNRNIGYILNFMCIYIINAIIKLEDISAEAAEQLLDTLKVILTRGPKLFSDPKEICLYVESWYKMNELVFVLGSSLVDIDDRWADGKGPLALQFQPEDLKKLIRALFQNTDRRAAVLAKI